MIAEERPRLALTHSFSKLFKDLGLSTRAVSTAFGSRVNLAVCLQVGQLQICAVSSVNNNLGPHGTPWNAVYVFMVGYHWS